MAWPGHPCSAQLKLASSDVDVDVDVDAECRNVGMSEYRLATFLALLPDMGKMLQLPSPLPGGWSAPSNLRLDGGSLVGFFVSKKVVTSAHQRPSCSVPLRYKSQTPTDTDLSTR